MKPMNTRRVVRTVAVAVVCLCATLPEALTAQAVEGQLTLPSGEPVVGAKTTLLDDGFQPVVSGVSDDAGRYSLLAPAAGDYIVVVDVEGFVSQMSDFVTVTAAGTVTLDVVVEGRGVDEHHVSPADTMTDAQLLAAGIAEACRDEFIPAMHGVLFGSVRDAETGSVIPGATVAVQWERSNRVTFDVNRYLEARADEAGIYLLCKAPGEEDLKVRASFQETEGVEVTQRLRLGNMRRVDLEIPLYADEPGQVWGLVRDQTTGDLLSGVDVRVTETDVRVESDANGVFRMPAVPWGLRSLTFEHVSYGRQEQTLRVIGGRSMRVEVFLAPAPIEMPPLLVSVRPRRWFGDMEGLQARIDRGQGVIMTSEALEERRPRNLGDALRAVPGVTVRQSGGALNGTYVVQMRQAQSLMGQVCPPAVWVDGQKWRDQTDVYSIIQGTELEVVEIYRGPSEVPGEFLDSSAACGALIVWTKRGRSFGR